MLARAIATNLKGILEEPSPSEAYPQGMDPSNPGELASQVETIPDLVGLLKRVYNETKGNPMEFLEFCEELRESMRRLVKPSL